MVIKNIENINGIFDYKIYIYSLWAIILFTNIYKVPEYILVARV